MYSQVSSSADHSLALKDGYVYGKGNNNYGQLTNSRFQFEPDYIRISNLTDIKQVLVNDQLSMILTKAGEIYWFGLKFSEVKKFPEFLLGSIKMMACGKQHYLFLTNDGTVYGYGKNDFGQLGSIVDYILAPTKIEGLVDIVKIAAGKKFSLALDKNQNLYVFGDNSRGQLGIGKQKVVINPVRNYFLNNIVDIAAGNKHSLVLTNDNFVHAFGDNRLGQLGITFDNVKMRDTPYVSAINVSKILAKDNYSLVENLEKEMFVTGVLNEHYVNHWVKLGKAKF